MRRHLTKKRSILLGAAASLAVAAVAVAFWTSSGSGSGTAATGTAGNVTVNQTSTVSGLYPGGPAQTLSGDFTNANGFSVNIASITATVSATSDETACPTSNFVIGGSAGPYTVPDGTNVGSWSGLTVALQETNANQDGCQGKSITVSYTANAS
jgi:hypothetical protein